MVMKWVSKLLDGVFTDDDFEELFAAIGKEYDRTAEYTIQDLIDFKFDDFNDLINSIYKRGHINMISSQQVVQVKELWTRKIKFKLAKSFPLKAFNADVDEQRVFDDARFSGKKSESCRVKELDEQSKHLSDESAYMNANASYRLVDVNEIRQAYDDSVIKLRNVLTNSVKPKLKDEAQELLGKLDEAVYLTELWWQVQFKWLMLEKIYATEDNPSRTLGKDNHAAYYAVVKELRAFQFRIADNSLVLNIINRVENKNGLRQWDSRLGQIADDVEQELEISCVQYPRFYFLSREMLVEVNSVSRDCRRYFDAVRHCFPSVKDLVYSLPTGREKNEDEIDKIEKPANGPGIAKSMTLLEFDINSSVLEVKGLIGCFGQEVMDFFTPVVSYERQKPAEWFDHFQKIMKSSLCWHVQTYLQKLEAYGKLS